MNSPNQRNIKLKQKVKNTIFLPTQLMMFKENDNLECLVGRSIKISYIGFMNIIMRDGIYK